MAGPKSAKPLHAQDLWAGYPGVEPLRGVTLDVVPGEAPIGVVGESGVGKSTLLRALAGKIKPLSGSVTWGKRPVHRIGPRDKREFRAAVSHVGQQELVNNVDQRKTVDAVVKAGLAEARKAGRTVSLTVGDLLESLALPASFGSRQMYTISGGERQRVALARAIASRPDILLLDEPLTALDPATRLEVATAIKDVLATLGTGMLLVTHDLELMARMTSTVHFLADGVFVADGPLDRVLAESGHPSVRGLAEAAPLAVQRMR